MGIFVLPIIKKLRIKLWIVPNRYTETYSSGLERCARIAYIYRFSGGELMLKNMG
jgi:hypothetical protein